MENKNEWFHSLDLEKQIQIMINHLQFILNSECNEEIDKCVKEITSYYKYVMNINKKEKRAFLIKKKLLPIILIAPLNNPSLNNKLYDILSETYINNLTMIDYELNTLKKLRLILNDMNKTKDYYNLTTIFTILMYMNEIKVVSSKSLDNIYDKARLLMKGINYIPKEINDDKIFIYKKNVEDEFKKIKK